MILHPCLCIETEKTNIINKKFLPSIIKSLTTRSGEAPAGPEHQQRGGVRDQDQQVEAEQEAVELGAKGQPLGLSGRLAVLLGEGQVEGNQLLQKPLQPRWNLRDLIQGQQIFLQRGVKLIICFGMGTMNIG